MHVYSPDHCPLGEFVESDDPKDGREFARHVLAELKAYSYEEIGDELPNSPANFNVQCVESFDSAQQPYEPICEFITACAVECARKRYLGICATIGCKQRDIVSKMIDQAPTKPAVSTLDM